MEKHHIGNVQDRYNEINKAGLKLQYNIAVILTVFAFIAEVLIGVYVIQTPLLESSSLPVFLMKYIIVPTLTNSVLLFVGHYIINTSELDVSNKALSLSLIIVAISFVLFSAHSAFTATYYFYIHAVFLTVIYAEPKITKITFFVSVSALIFSELFLFWDVDRTSIFQDPSRMVNFFTAIAILLATGIISIIVVNIERQKNDASIDLENQRLILESRLQFDEMTGLYNKLELQNTFAKMSIQNDFDQNIFVFLDINNFKHVNDYCGHQAGDQCIAELSTILLSLSNDFKSFRFGGDEFCLLFHNFTIDQVVSKCEAINETFINLVKPIVGNLDISISFGVSQCSQNQSIPDLIDQTDKALYEAKKYRQIVKVVT
ncbi:hypothetical protein AOC36_07245 [Erysipelothrix larvae]|uniref:GGDEF domain-containing protein n=1 Tax=Erysipelothrix larvae TaxID=1514105 RepID=A0A0X8H0K2_9FIRM|nr:GGDEF domain-containing protein [Erysipelothrix larvae]AMC93784.1 hypothetical protein AOC36_07245 [Erysipelothrix larvae]